jgi:hypothetical protein
MERHAAHPFNSRLARRAASFAKDATPRGAPSRHSSAAFAANSAPGRASWDEASVPVPVQRSSSQSGHNAARAESRGRPGAGLRGLPAGAASCSIIRTSHDDALEEQDAWTIFLVIRECQPLIRHPEAAAKRPSKDARPRPGRRPRIKVGAVALRGSGFALAPQGDGLALPAEDYCHRIIEGALRRQTRLCYTREIIEAFNVR